VRANLVAVCILAAAPALVGQREVTPHRQRVIDEVHQRQRDIRAGKLDQVNVRVTVRLKNEHKMQGVVKKGRLIEAVSGLEFVEARRNDPDSGIRVWYYNNTNSYIFLPFSIIKDYKIQETLTDLQVKAIETRIEERRQEEKRKAEEAAKVAPPDAQPPVPEPASGQPSPPPEKTEGPAPPAGADLLKEFPPEEGWSLEKAEEIERRKVVVGAFPSEREKRFLAVVQAWERARRAVEVKPPAGGELPPVPPK
jgi:hypothetical protein